MSARPYALLAFSFDPQHALAEVKQELGLVQDMFVTNGSVPLARWQVSQDWIEKSFEEYRQDIRVFHFAGHAGPNKLQTNFRSKRARYTFVDGLARNMGLFGKGLKLVFLNGCSTKDQVDCFLNNGIPAVIATRKPVADNYACNFARIFYEKFTGGNTLEEAFESAKNSFDSRYGNFCDRLKKKICSTFLHEAVRSNYVNDDDDESLEIYELHTRGDCCDIRQEKFADWFSSSKSGETEQQKTDHDKVDGGKHESGYLLCNRGAQVSSFHKVLEAKIKGDLPEPQFFFVFDTDPNCPQLLPERFKTYALRQLFEQERSVLDPDKSTNHFHDLPLPEPHLFESSGPYSDLYKTELSQIYYDKYKGSPPMNNELARIQEWNSPLLVVQHRLKYGDWRGADNMDKLEALLRFYIGEYAPVLQRELSKRLVILFQTTLQQNDPLWYNAPNGIFHRLKIDYPPIHLLTRLTGISFDDLQDWERDFLKVPTNDFLDTDFILSCTNPETGQNEVCFDRPYKTIIDKLKSEIRRFNKQHGYAA
ncbi:MAG: CHAT domain-containing protein [Saprospiraceae bacterium]